MHGNDPAARKAINLAKRSTIRVGPVEICPSTREIIGPDGRATLRPQPMVVFLILADNAGDVISRDELVMQAWSGRFVAEDSLNGAIYEIRRALRSVGAKSVKVVTVPKTGYRLLLGNALNSPDSVSTGASSVNLASRRGFFGAGATVLLGGGATWLWQWSGHSRQVDFLMEMGLIALRQGLPEQDTRGVEAFRQAVELDPNNARAWGLLALALKVAAEFGSPNVVARYRTDAEAAARRALAIDPLQSDAHTALALLTPSFGRWSEADQQLRTILARDPDNSFAVAGLATLLMSTGQVQECLDRLDWLEKRVPLSPNLQFRRVYTLWSAGRLPEADATADRAVQAWPRHPAVWFARMWTFAFTKRLERAIAMLSDRQSRPDMPDSTIELLQLSLEALAKQNASVVHKAIGANVAAAAVGPGPAVSAIMVLSNLGATTQAFEVVRGFLLQQGKVMVRQHYTSQQASVADQHHRMTMMLWIPATRPLRLDNQFEKLCDDIGLTSYWRIAGVRPDFSIGTQG